MPPLSPGTALRFTTSFETRFSGSSAAFDAEAEASFTTYLAAELEVQPSRISHSMSTTRRRLSEGDYSVSTTVTSDTAAEAASVEARLSSRVTPAEISDTTGVGAVEMGRASTTAGVVSLVPPSPPEPAVPPPLLPPEASAFLSFTGILAIAVGGGGGLLLCCLCVLCIVCCVRRRRRKRRARAAKNKDRRPKAAKGKDRRRAADAPTFSNLGNDTVSMSDMNRESAPRPPVRHAFSSPAGPPSGPLKQKSSGMSEVERIRRNRAERDAAKGGGAGQGSGTGGESPPRPISHMTSAGLPPAELKRLRDELMAV
jgi:hypothetical protein